MELLASGRTAEVFAWGDGRVLKLDRPEWNGVSGMEAATLATVVAAGVRAPRVYDTVVVDDRHGVVLERVDGPILDTVIADAPDVDALARTWTEMHAALNASVVAGLPDLVTGLVDGIRRSGLAAPLVAELLALLATVDDGRRSLCHFDLHPQNVIVTDAGWVVIDWLTASAGPPPADFARTLVLQPPTEPFMAAVLAQSLVARALDREQVDAWIRVVAAARISEGFTGAMADRLAAWAAGAAFPGATH